MSSAIALNINAALTLRKKTENFSFLLRKKTIDFVMIIQIMLNTLRIAYDDLGDFSVNGTLDKESMYAIKEFQRLNFLPQTGLVDVATWNSLAAGYNKYIKVN